ncbi:MAG TPA: hypothetical protein VFO36_14115, partial [Nitrospiraceae bacterium]|nr:hypothetical protein [Nitrospiraceae bacterium]
AGEAAIVLLGDPGMGKSTLFRRYAGEHYTTVRRFLNQRVAPANGPLFLDALDEYRAVSASGTALDDVAKALHQSSKPFFRLSCRAADWYGQVDEEILKDASSSGRLVVLELLPFTELQIRQLVAGIVPDVERFMDEADQAGLGPLLGNPQSLELIAVAWNGPRPPRNKFEAFDGGIEKLLRERNAHHADRSPERYRDDDLRRAAGSAAAVILLSNAVGISRTEVGDGDYLGSSQVPYRPAAHVDAAFKRRIFSSPTPDRFEFTHRTVAEFLAAEDLARRINEGLPVDRVLALMCGVDGKPISSLRGLFAWVMCHLGPSSEMYIELDPYGVATYGDASALTPGAQARVWDSLRTLRDPWFLANEDDRGTFRGLATVGTTSTLRDVVLDEASSTHLKIAALEAVANSASDLGLSAIARDIALQPSDNTWLRTTALKAYARSAGGTSDLEMLDGDLA